MNVSKEMWRQFGDLHLIHSSRGTNLMNSGDERLPRARIKQESCITLTQLEILKLLSATQAVQKAKQGRLLHKVLPDRNPNHPTHNTGPSKNNSPITFCCLQEMHAFIHLFYLTYNLHFPVSK